MQKSSETMQIKPFVKLCLGALLLVLQLPISSEAQAPAKFDSLRLENEITYDIPLEKAEDVWKWMQEYFNKSWQSSSTRFDTFRDVEQFVDTYFDTPERVLVNQYIGVRHRRRFYPQGGIKELIQVKQPHAAVQQGKEAEKQTRGELKFELKNPTITYDTGDIDYLNEDLLSIVKNVHRPLLIARLQEMGATPSRVRPLLSIKQERRRIYFRENGNQFFTVTLDLAASQKLWIKGKFAQLDIEIGEIAFTQASSEKRESLLKIQQELQTLLLNKFPELRRNQIPKIVQMLRVIENQGFVSKIIIRFGSTALLILGLLLLIVLTCVTFNAKKEKKTLKVFA